MLCSSVLWGRGIQLVRLFLTAGWVGEVAFGLVRRFLRSLVVGAAD